MTDLNQIKSTPRWKLAIAPLTAVTVLGVFIATVDSPTAPPLPEPVEQIRQTQVEVVDPIPAPASLDAAGPAPAAAASANADANVDDTATFATVLAVRHSPTIRGLAAISTPAASSGDCTYILTLPSHYLDEGWTHMTITAPPTLTESVSSPIVRTPTAGRAEVRWLGLPCGLKWSKVTVNRTKQIELAVGRPRRK
jgi:hypothetical protein